MIAVPAEHRSELVMRYMQDKCGANYDLALSQVFAILSDKNEFVGGVVVTNYRGHDAEIACAVETSAAFRPQVMQAVFTYVFGKLGCKRCTAITRKNNKAARAFLERLDFRLEGTVRLGYDGFKDALIYGLLAAECRYFDGELDGQKEHPKSANAT